MSEAPLRGTSYLCDSALTKEDISAILQKTTATQVSVVMIQTSLENGDLSGDIKPTIC